MTRFTPVAAFRAAALLGVLGVGLGAFGAHGLKGWLMQRGTADFWEKAVFYHLVHCPVMLLAASLDPFPRRAWAALGLGVLGFSGSLYLYALTRTVWLTFITPFGGLALLTGWLLLALRRSPVGPG